MILPLEKISNIADNIEENIYLKTLKTVTKEPVKKWTNKMSKNFSCRFDKKIAVKMCQTSM